MKIRLGRTIAAVAVGAGALGAGFGGTLAIASAATTHTSAPSSASSTVSTTAPSNTAATSTPTATPSHNCPNLHGRSAPSSQS